MADRSDLQVRSDRCLRLTSFEVLTAALMPALGRANY